MTACICPHTDGYRIRNIACPVHGERDAEVLAEKHAERQAEAAREDAEEMACAWSDYRKDYGVNARDTITAHKAFTAGWKAAREGDQSAVLS